MRFLPIIALMLMACGSKSVLVQTPVPQEVVTPTWVQSKPISSFDYIGVGRGSKASADYTLLAKRNALADLASEIQVRVDAESVLYTLEHDDRFDETFSEVIFLSSDIDLEGFDAYDSFENEEEYWVYYRLNKEDYARIMAERKRVAIDLADAHLDSALDYYKQGNPALSAQQAILALEILEPYWSEVNSSQQYENIGLMAIQHLADLRGQLDFGLNQEEFFLNEANDFQMSLRGQLNYNETPLNSAPMHIEQGGEMVEQIGPSFQILLRPQLSRDARVKLSLDPFKAEREKKRGRAYDFLKDMLRPLEKEILVRTIFPLVTVAAIHLPDGGLAKQNRDMEAALASLLSDIGIRMDGSGESRFEIMARASTRDGGQSLGQHIAYSKAVFTLRDTRTNEVRSELLLKEVKGVHRDLQNAERLSLEKLNRSMDEVFLKALINGLF